MAHSLFTQHRIGYRNQRLNSQFSAFSAAQSHSTSGTRHVLLRLRRFSPLSYVNDYWATVQFIRQYKHCEHHAPTNNQDSLTRLFARRLDMTNTIFRTRHHSVIVIATLMKTSPNHTRQGLKCRVGLAAVLVVVEHLAVVQEVVVHVPS